MTSQHPRSAAFPAKQNPDAIPIEGTSPLRRAKRANAIVSRPETVITSVSPGRPPPPSANRTTGQSEPFDDVEQPVLLAVVDRTLRAGQHHVVVGEDRARDAVHAPDATDEAIGRRLGDQVLDRSPAPLRREGEALRTRRTSRGRRGPRRSRARCGGHEPSVSRPPRGAPRHELRRAVLEPPQARAAVRRPA